MSQHLQKARKEYRQMLQEEYRRRMVRYQHDLLCAENGWKAWPQNASEEQKDAALDALLNGGGYDLYPSGYVEDSVDTSGKLQLAPQPEERPRRWWEVWK